MCFLPQRSSPEQAIFLLKSLELIYKIDTSLSKENFKLLIEALNKSSEEQSRYYFNALTFYCNHLKINQKLELEAALFNYFIHQPKSYISNIKKMEIQKDRKIIKINASEKILLENMISSAGKIFSREEISKITNLIQERSIDVLVTRLRQKIEPDPKNPKYLQTVRGTGYVLWLD